MKLFAALREQRGARQVEIELADGSRVDAVWPALGLGDDQPYVVRDLLTNARYDWSGPNNFVQLDPTTVPAHIFSVSTP